MLNIKFLEWTKGILDLNFMEVTEVIASIPQALALVAHEQSLDIHFDFDFLTEEIKYCLALSMMSCKALEWWNLCAWASVVSASAHTGDATRVLYPLWASSPTPLSLSWEETSVLVSLLTAEVVDRPCDPGDRLESSGPADPE